MLLGEYLGRRFVVLCFLQVLSKNILVYSREVNSFPLVHAHIFRAWSEWTHWSTCSRTCGGGVRMRTRMCRIKNLATRTVSYTALPKTCLGENTEYELCKTYACAPDDDFLAYQCSQHNGHVVAGSRIDEWVPFSDGKHQCELQCWPKDRTFVYSFGKVIDGTRCTSHRHFESALCVNGRCMQIDCAGQLGSDNRRDKCGVCRGDNSTCVKYENSFRKRARNKQGYEAIKDYHYDYNEITMIPAGATHVLVEENSNTNFLVLVDHNGLFQINGNWKVQSPGRFIIHDSEFTYNRAWNGYERISTSGPTRNDFYIFVLGTGEVPTVNCEYWVSSTRLKPTLKSLNLVKNPERSDHPKSYNQYEHSPDNSIVIPVPKIQGYKSYYHRNEILKSVPSWSSKRHRNYKHKTNGYIITSPTPRTTFIISTLPPKLVDPALGDSGRPNVSSALSKADQKRREYTVEKRQQKKQSPRRKQPVDKISVNRDNCLPCEKVKQEQKNFCASDFVLRALVLGWEKMHKSIRYEMEVTQSYKNKVPILAREYLWTAEACRCPKLRIGREYILMGHTTNEGKRETRLTLDRYSFVRRYSRKRERRMLKLARDQNSMCKRKRS